jgi:hypothetical protein
MTERERLRPFQPVIVHGFKRFDTGEVYSAPARVVRELAHGRVYVEVQSVYLIVSIERVEVIPNWNGFD